MARVVETKLSFENVPREISDEELANWLEKQPEEIFYKIKCPSDKKRSNENDKTRKFNPSRSNSLDSMRNNTGPSDEEKGTDYFDAEDFWAEQDR